MIKPIIITAVVLILIGFALSCGAQDFSPGRTLTNTELENRIKNCERVVNIYGKAIEDLLNRVKALEKERDKTLWEKLN